MLFFGNIAFQLRFVPFLLSHVLEHFLFVLIVQLDFFDFPLQLLIVLFQCVNVSGKLVHVVIERVVLFLRFDESVGYFLKRVDSTLLLYVVKGFFNHLHVLFVLLNHLEFFLV